MPRTPQKPKKRPLLSLSLPLLGAFIPLAAQQPTPSPPHWGDQSNGTYANPVLPADFSDLDAIRVGDQYFAISSTLQYAPGMVVLQSADLVNWHIIGHVVADISTLDPNLSWAHMDRAGRGIWAGAIRFHEGRFWVYFTTPDTGIFLATATNPAGPWTPPVRVLPDSGWDDPCPLWDDDGKLYLVTTHFKPEPANGKTYNIHLFQLTPDGQQILPATDRIIHQSRGSEANKLYKIHGTYFHLYSEVAREGRVVMMERSKSLAGPWETHQLIHVNAALDKEPNQGGLIELPSGSWYFFTHQGKGDWEGRAAVLLPVTWIDNWPILGQPGPDHIGNMVWQHAKPIPGSPLTNPFASDDFSTPTLRPEWEWNYQPRPDKWSLTDRPGFLRLHAFPSLRPNDLLTTGNILTQRSMRSALSTVTTRIDIAHMADGQQAGLAHFTKHFATLGVVQHEGIRSLTYNSNGLIQTGPTLTGDTIWLRSTWGFDGISHFAYSLNGEHFQPFGDAYQLEWGSYRGDRIGLFTSNPNNTGSIDIDSFTYEVAR